MILEHYKGEEVFVKKILDYKYQALDHQRMILTPFYNPHEREIVKSIVGKELLVKSYGCFINAENKRMIICPEFYDVVDDDFQVVLVEIIYNPQFGKLQHKDVLGALMNLGIKRNCIGDIYDRNGLYFSCTTQTFPYIQTHLTKIKKSKIKLKLVHENIHIEHDYKTQTFFLSSLRLDKVIASMFKVSRQVASEAIRAGNCKVNYKVVEEVSFLCHNNDMISLKHYGRVKISIENRQTKQGNEVVIGYFYK